MTYDEVIDGIQNKTLEGSFNAVFFQSKDNYFGCYTISSPGLDDPGWINIYFEGGYLFSSCGEEESYSLDDVPEEAKNLLYTKESEYPVDTLGYVSEYALFKLFPTLPSPEDIWSNSDKADFIKSVKEHFLKNSDKVNLLD